MNDPLKDFVERHREDFDHLDAPEFNLQLLKTKTGTTVQKKKTLPFTLNKWLVAAAILLMFGSGVLIFRMNMQEIPAKQYVAKHKRVDQAKPALEQTPQLDRSPELAHLTTSKKVHKQQPKASLAKPATYLLDERLSDSSSASNRLAAILAIDKSELISEHTINQLAKTLEKDGSSNVRLAALGVMEKYKTDAHVSGLLLHALNNQKDPMVQLALVNLLGTMDRVKIEESLYALVSNPETFNAVKDEAYHILMKEENK